MRLLLGPAHHLGGDVDFLGILVEYVFELLQVLLDLVVREDLRVYVLVDVEAKRPDLPRLIRTHCLFLLLLSLLKAFLLLSKRGGSAFHASGGECLILLQVGLVQLLELDHLPGLVEQLLHAVASEVSGVEVLGAVLRLLLLEGIVHLVVEGRVTHAAG